MSIAEAPAKLDYLGSFEEEKNRYKPKDMIDFSIEYFKALQENKPLEFKDLSGLEKFVLHPADQEVISRLGISEEDLKRVQERRKVLTKEEIYENIEKKIIEFCATDKENKDEMFQYQKFKNNSFKENEFLRFINGIEKLSIKADDNRIYFTKLFGLKQEEKNLVFKFLDNDFKVVGDPKLNDWKTCLERLENTEKHTYYKIDNLTFKLEEYAKDIDNGKANSINFEEFKLLIKDYEHYINEYKELTKPEIYAELMKKPQFEREIIYLISKIMNSNDSNLSTFFEKVNEVYTTHFSHLTNFDFYDYVLSCFIPLIKNSIKTSIEHREMESFLNEFIASIPKFININFLEEKKLYYDIECIKYFLIKDNKIKENTQVLIDIIKMFLNNLSYLQGVKNSEEGKLYPEVAKKMSQQYDLIYLQLKEFYADIVAFIDKVLSIANKHDIDSELDVQSSIRSEFKSYSNKGQELILNSLKMCKIFEQDEEKQNRLENTYIMLSTALSIQEKALIIQDKSDAETYKKILEKKSSEFYSSSIKKPKYNFNDLPYLDLLIQSQVTSLLIRQNQNLKNSALLYEKEKIIPNLETAFMTEKLFDFNLLFFKLIFEPDMKDQLNKDGNALIQKMKTKFEKEYAFIEAESAKDPETYDIEAFKAFSKTSQKLILTYLNFLDNFLLTTNNAKLINKLSVIYLKDKVEYIKSKVFKEKNLAENKIFLDSLYQELKHVDYPIFIYIKYDRSNEVLKYFDDEHKSLVKLILQTESLNESLELPDYKALPLLLNEDESVIAQQLEANYPMLKAFIDNYENQKDNKEELLFDFSFFKKEEKIFIINYLSKLGKDASMFSEVDPSQVNDFAVDEYRKIILCESDNKASEDVRLFYRKKLLEIRKLLEGGKGDLINNVLEYPYDPNNQYLYESFNQFNQNEKFVIVQSIFSHMKILGFHSLYYDNLLHLTLPTIFQNLLKLGTKYENCQPYFNYVEEQFKYFLNFFPGKLGKFVKDVMYSTTKTIFEFTQNFSEIERDMIILFLELFSFLKKNEKEKYDYIKERLELYKTDLKFDEKVNHIFDDLKLLLDDQGQVNTFILLCEEVKESFYELDYVIQSLVADEHKEIDPFILKLFKSMEEKEKDILIMVLKGINKLNQNEKLCFCIEELSKVKEENLDFDIFGIIKSSFEEVKKKLNFAGPDDKEKMSSKFEELKSTLSNLVGDLFKFCEDCKSGDVKLRKIFAVSKKKVEIIKVILDVEYLLHKHNRLKSAIDHIQKLNL